MVSPYLAARSGDPIIATPFPSDGGINMSMVVSRPDKKYAGSYRFFIDCDSFGTIENLNAAIEEMKGEGAAISIKGIYCRSSWEMPDYP